MTHKLIVEGQDFSADCDDVGLYIDVDRDTRTSTLLALAIEIEGDIAGHRQPGKQARFLALNPALIIADESVSALDVSVQAAVTDLLMDIQRENKTTLLFISHDLSVVRHISDRVAVMYLGHIMEITSRDELYERPLHPYTQALMAAVDSTIGEEVGRVGNAVQGEIPSPLSPPSGCPFHPRCPMAEERCRREKPALRAFGPSHQVACHFAESTR